MTRIYSLIKKYSSLLGVVLFAIILLQIDSAKLWDIFTASKLHFILLSASIAPVILFFMAVRWYVILRSLEIDYSFKNTCISLNKGIFLGLITPGQVGELYRAKYVASEKEGNLAKALFSVVIDRVYDVVILGTLATVSCLILTSVYAIKLPVLPIFLGTTGIFLFAFVFINGKIRKAILSPVINYLVPENHREVVNGYCTEFFAGANKVQGKTFLLCTLISLGIWVLKFQALFFLAKALEINLPFWFVLSVGSVASMVVLIPISISGFGTREAIFILFFSLLQIPTEFAVALSFLFFVFGLWTVGTSMGFVFLYNISSRKNNP